MIIWASSQTQYGHAAFAVQDYNNECKALDTYTVYGLFPISQYSLADAVQDENVRALFRISYNTTLERIINGDFNSGEDSMPDGILEIDSDYEHDKIAKSTMQNGINQNKGYCGASRNCATYAREGVRAATGNTEISGEESIMYSNFVTPNQLYNDTKINNNVNTIVDAEDKTDYKINEHANNLYKVK